MQSLLHEICESVGLSLQRATQVFGGDINQSYCLHTSEAKFFVKLNDAAQHPGMFASEADGLRLLRNKSRLVVPEVRSVGETNNQQWLLMEWIEKGTAATGFWKAFAEGLAELHRNSQAMFGLQSDNYIGSLPQKNEQQNSWAEFYAEQRLFPLCKVLFDRRDFSNKELQIVENAEQRLVDIFPQEPPALLHGDLWSGNFMVGTNGAAIFDPAVYYGHREMDIGMSLLFGGFDRQMYEVYNEAWPLEGNWKNRIQITQLYPLLVHAVLFGGHYINSAAGIFLELA